MAKVCLAHNTSLTKGVCCMSKVQYSRIIRNRKNFAGQRLAVLLLISVLVAIPSNNIADTSSSPSKMVSEAAGTKFRHNVERQHPDPAVQTIYAPAIGLQEFSRAEIVLNNNSPNSMDITPTFYTTQGNAIAGNMVTLEPAEVRHADIADLLSPDHQGERIGGMTLTYFGGMMEVVAQTTLIGSNGIASVDIPFSGTMDYRSTVQEAVWWMPKKGEATILLGNATDTSITAHLLYSNGESQDVTIGPLVTELVRRSSAKRKTESVRIETSGPIGSLRATGFVTSSKRHFNSGIRFYDPDTIRQPHLFATNLRLKNANPRLVLKNIGDLPVSAKPIFVPISGELGSTLESPAVSIEPHQAVEVDLQRLQKKAAKRNLDMVSVKVVNESGANNLIGSLYSTDPQISITSDVPLRDSGPVRNSTGSYPWRVDGDYSALVTITNTSDQAARYRASINYTGGKYNLDIRDIAAGETVIFDLKKIRDEQIPDKDGSTIPLTVTAGQFRWSLIGGDSVRLIGRNEVISLSQGVSSSFSCPVCCPDSFSFLDISPNSSSGPVGGTALLAVDGFLLDCYHTTLGPYDWSVSQWLIVDEDVLSLSMISTGTAEMSCLEAGESDFIATTTDVYYDNDGMDCYQRVNDFSDDGTGEVRPLITVSTTSFNPTSVKTGGMDTTTGSVSISASPGSAEGLQSGDFAVVEIIKNTSGGNFTYTPSAQTQNVVLSLGDSVTAQFTVQANLGTSAGMYSFTIRVSDIRRPDGGGGSTSILTMVMLMPTQGGMAANLTVTN